MSYTVTVTTTTMGSELVSAYLYQIGAIGIAIQDKQDLLDLMQNKSEIFWDYIDDQLLEQDDAVKVTAFYEQLPSNEQLSELSSNLAFAKEQMPVDMGVLDIVMGQTTDDDSWYENWKAYYKPIQVGDITVVPAWQQQDGKIVVKIDPCMAFGTGEHESTQMCLLLLQKLDVKGKIISDIGCGSGILGISSLKMGAKHCYFADIDDDAMRNMRENARLNEVSNYTAKTACLLEKCDQVADVMLANITADILIKLADNAGAFIVDGGYMIISGIIAERQQEVLDAYMRQGFKVKDKAALKDWRAFLLEK